MGKKQVLAPRNSAEAVALGVSACFLVVAGVVVHGNADLDRAARPATTNLAASVEVPRTVSRPSALSEYVASRLPSLLVPQPPLVLLPLDQQARAKAEAVGTPRGEGAILVAYSRGAGTLTVGGGLPGVVSAAPRQPSGVVGFPTGPGTVSAAPTVSGPTPTTPPPSSETTPPPSTETTPPPSTETTPPPSTETTPPPSSGGSGDGGTGGGSTDGGSTGGGSTGGGGTGGGSTDGGSTGGSTDGVGTGATTGTTGTAAEQQAAPEAVAAPAPTPQTSPADGPTPESLQD